MGKLYCPVAGCEGKLPYVNAKTSRDKSVRVWKRRCPNCGAVILDTGVYSREVIVPGGGPPDLKHPLEGAWLPNG